MPSQRRDTSIQILRRWLLWDDNVAGRSRNKNCVSRQRRLHLATLLHLIVGTLLTPEACSFADIHGDSAVLEQIAVTHEANLVKIQTWQGNARIERRTTRASEDSTTTARIWFALDRDREAWIYRWWWEPVTRPSGNVIEQAETGGMYVDDMWHVYGLPYVGGLHQRRGIVITPGYPDRVGPLTGVFDPTYFFGVWNDSVQKKIRVWRDNEDSSWLKLTIRREETRVNITEENVNIPGASVEYQFDLSNGANVTSVTADDGVIKEHWDNSWQKVDEVWVPREAIYLRKKHGSGEEWREVIAWSEMALNIPLPEKTFTLDSLGADPGTIISDYRLGKGSVYKENEYKELNQPAPMPTEKLKARPGVRFGRRLLIIINMILLPVVLAGIIWMLHRKRKSQ